jgi:hypothetical protein
MDGILARNSEQPFENEARELARQILIRHLTLRGGSAGYANLVEFSVFLQLFYTRVTRPLH